MNTKITAKEIVDLSRAYSLYTISNRAIPHVSDGMKAAARRLLWKAKDGKRHKTVTLAGSTLDIHPHGLPESAANTLAAFYGNNVPLMDGDGSFGTLIDPTEYGATRYTHMQVSQFTKDCVYIDIDILPHQANYDGTTTEPMHFLPLIPIVLLNPQDGIASGFAASILPRSLDDIIKAQLSHLKNKKIVEPNPTFLPTKNFSTGKVVDNKGDERWVFKADIDVVNTSTVKINTLPYGVQHAKYITTLHKFIEADKIASYTDDSKDIYDITVKFKRGALKGKTVDEVRSMLGLTVQIKENLNVIDFDGQSIYPSSFKEIVQDFTDWRLSWYKTRYEHKRDLLKVDIQRYLDIIKAINKNVGGLAKKTESRAELKELLASFDIVMLDYIADLPVYRFTQAEKQKIQDKLTEAQKVLKQYNRIIKNEKLRVDIYVDELTELAAKSKKGIYSQDFYD